MRVFGRTFITTCLVLGAACGPAQWSFVEESTAASTLYKPTRIVPPPKVPGRTITPDSLRKRPPGPGTGGDKSTPTAQPENPKRNPGNSGGSNKRLAAPKAPQPPKLPGLPNVRPVVAEDLPDSLLGALVGAGDFGFDPNTILVLMPEGTDDAFVEAFAQRFELDVLESTPVDLLDGAVLIRLQVAANAQILEVLEQVSAEYPAVANYYYRTTGAGQGTQSIQFAPQRMSVGEAHKIATGNAVRIAIIDTGIDDKHAELSGSITERFDAVGAAPGAPTKHGTAMAGVIAAKDQITGIAPNVKILSAQAFAPPKDGDSATGTTFAIIKSMDWAYKSGARVFNLSFAGPRDKLLIRALDALADHDTIMIGAAGNAGPGKPPAYPAAHVGVIAVTATDQNDGLYAMANRGSYVAVAAPGVDIITTTPGGGYEFMSGTSIATAHITGVVALVLERHPELKAGQVAQLLANASVDLGPKGIDSEFGAGLVDAAAALKSSDEMADTATYGLTAGQ